MVPLPLVGGTATGCRTPPSGLRTRWTAVIRWRRRSACRARTGDLRDEGPASFPRLTHLERKADDSNATAEAAYPSPPGPGTPVRFILHDQRRQAAPARGVEPLAARLGVVPRGRLELPSPGPEPGVLPLHHLGAFAHFRRDWRRRGPPGHLTVKIRESWRAGRDGGYRPRCLRVPGPALFR